MNTSLRYSALLALLMVAACTTVPTGPSVMVMPGTGRSFDQFRAADAECRRFAFVQVGGATPDQVIVDSGVKSAIVGTAVGAAAGAALGGHNGAGAGAGMGLLVGSIAGAGASQASAYGLQRRYDNAYVQCMYTKGDRVPVSGHFASASDPRAYSSPAPPLQNALSPPPANFPPPPPR